VHDRVFDQIGSELPEQHPVAGHDRRFDGRVDADAPSGSIRPHVVDRILSPSGKTITQTRPKELGRAIDSRTARALTAAMKAVVAGGTGTNAQIPGIAVAGKTGTAETGRTGVNTTSFISFAPADSPQVAIAVILEGQRGVGGTTAAPIAKSVLQALLRVPSK